jgi:hypothetical protein
MRRTFAFAGLLAAGLVVGAVAPSAQGTPPASVPVEADPSKPPADKDGKEVPAPQGYTYKAEGRRDPFVTLVMRGSETASTTAAGRAAGLAGLTTGEVMLRGVLASEGAYLAMLLGSDEKTYIVRPGDKLADGTIRTITADSMVILQQSKDPLATHKVREVRKMLRQIEAP